MRFKECDIFGTSKIATLTESYTHETDSTINDESIIKNLIVDNLYSFGQFLSPIEIKHNFHYYERVSFAATLGNQELLDIFIEEYEYERVHSSVFTGNFLDSVCNSIASTGNLELLKYAHIIRGYTIDTETFVAAAKSGNIKILQWFEEYSTALSIHDQNATERFRRFL